MLTSPGLNFTELTYPEGEAPFGEAQMNGKISILEDISRHAVKTFLIYAKFDRK